MGKGSFPMSETNITWYLEPRDASSNAMIAGLIDSVDECPDKEVVGFDKAKKRVNVFRADEAKAEFIFESKGFKKLSFTLYKQEEGDEDIVACRVFVPRTKKANPFTVARRVRSRLVKKTKPVAVRRSIH